jgi:hypothetical protein
VNELELDDQRGVCRFYLILLLTQYRTDANYKNKKNILKKESSFGGIHGVSSAVILFVPKLRLVRTMV